MNYLFDADAFNCLYSLKIGPERLLQLLIGRFTSPALITGFVARHELSDLSPFIEPLLATGRALVHDVRKGSEAFTMRRALVREVDKGEAEAIAWAAAQDPRPLFISRDSLALKAAQRNKVPVTDVMGFVVECVEERLLTANEAEAALDPWSEPNREICRPRDYDGYATTFERRRALGKYYFRS